MPSWMCIFTYHLTHCSKHSKRHKPSLKFDQCIAVMHLWNDIRLYRNGYNVLINYSLTFHTPYLQFSFAVCMNNLQRFIIHVKCLLKLKCMYINYFIIYNNLYSILKCKKIIVHIFAIEIWCNRL